MFLDRKLIFLFSVIISCFYLDSLLQVLCECVIIDKHSVIGVSYNGSIPVSKTVDVGSIPTTPANKLI